MKEEMLTNYPLVKIEDKVEDLELQIYIPETDEVVNKRLSDFKGKWTVLFFYPADFTFVCPTELKDLLKIYDEVKSFGNVELMVVSTDTVFSHKRWIETESLLSSFKIPMVADRTTVISRYFGVLNQMS